MDTGIVDGECCLQEWFGKHSEHVKTKCCVRFEPIALSICPCILNDFIQEKYAVSRSVAVHFER